MLCDAGYGRHDHHHVDPTDLLPDPGPGLHHRLGEGDSRRVHQGGRQQAAILRPRQPQ